MPLIATGFGTDLASTPDHTSLNIGDLDVRIHLSMTSGWGPIFLTTHLIGQEGTSNNAWALSIHPNQAMRLAIYPDGVNIIGPESTVAIPFAADIEDHWLRATVDVDNGSNQRVFNYYTSEDGTSWSNLGAANITESGATSIFNSTAPLTVPGALALTFIGRVYYAEVRNGIGGTIVANPDFAAQAPGTTSFADSTGKTWTLSGNARIDTGIKAQQIGLLT